MDTFQLENMLLAGLIILACWFLCLFFAYGGIVKRRLFWRICRLCWQNYGRLRCCWLLMGLLLLAAAGLGFWRYRDYWEVGLFLPYLQFMLLAAYLLAMTFTDWRRQEICVDCSLFFALLCLLIVAWFSWRQGTWDMLFYALGGGLLGAALPLLIYLLRRDAIGLGDAMLLGCCGLYCGFYGILQLIFKAMLLGMLVSLALLSAKKVNLKTQLPFAPFVFLGLFI